MVVIIVYSGYWLATYIAGTAALVTLLLYPIETKYIDIVTQVCIYIPIDKQI